MLNKEKKQAIIIAIDGFSSCGKSTLAKSLSKQLGFAYVDTGAMYRAVALYLIEKNIDLKTAKEQVVLKALNEIDITFRYHPEQESSQTYLNGINVETQIRGKEVSAAVSEVSQIKVIRTEMKRLQQALGQKQNVVMDGRDIGTNVFPNAQLKLFLTAKPNIRAMRRYDELVSKGQPISFEEVEENIRLRDHNDTTRTENPLIKAKDAIEIDNSFLDATETLQLVLKIISEKNLAGI